MDHVQASTRGAASGPAPRLSVGGLFIEALARRDFAAMADCLGPSVRLRALLPPGPVELAGREEVTGWFRSLFGGPEGLELADATVGEVGPRLYLRWRVSLTVPEASGPSRLVEQHVFADGGERIGALDLLCSGLVEQPNTLIDQQRRAPCPQRQ
jgi:SnoaL-like domain